MSGGSSSTGSCTSVSDLKLGEEDKSTSTTHSSSSSGPLAQTMIPDDYFDAAIEESMEMLEKSALESSSDNDEYGGEIDMAVLSSKEQQPLRSSSPLSSSGATTPSTEEETFNVSLSESDIDIKLALFNQNVQIRSPNGRAAHANHHVSFPMPPPLPPIRVDRYSVVGRRRLSQCKEEENEEEELADKGAVNSALLSSMRKSSSLNEDSTTTDRRLFSDEEEEDVEKHPEVVEVKVEEVKAALPVTSRFTVVKTEHKEPEVEKPKVTTKLRSGVEAMLRNSSAKQNSQTIHFPCSAPVQNRVSVQTMFEPHLDKRYFDSSLVEIRSLNDSTQTVNEDASLNDSVDSSSNDIWVKRSEKAAASDDGVSAGRLE